MCRFQRFKRILDNMERSSKRFFFMDRGKFQGFKKNSMKQYQEKLKNSNPLISVLLIATWIANFFFTSFYNEQKINVRYFTRFEFFYPQSSFFMNYVPSGEKHYHKHMPEGIKKSQVLSDVGEMYILSRK